MLITYIPAYTQVLVKKRATLMGSVFEITVTDTDSSSAAENIRLVTEEVTRIENLISEWQAETQISEVNRNAGIQPVKVDREVFELTQRAIGYSVMSGGAFDISIAALDKIWVFDGSMTEVPDAGLIRGSIERVGYEHITLDSIHSTIYLTRPGMRIGFGSIGKGYAADKGRELMQRRGIKGGIVNASGDIATWGRQPGGKPWYIGVSNPFKLHRIIKTLKLTEGAVATSGNYQQYAEINGVRYTHIINPATGYPTTGLASVTVWGPSAEFANALSTSIMVLGKKKGRKLIKNFPLYKCMVVQERRSAL